MATPLAENHDDLDDIRVITSTILTPEQIKLLEGAPVLDPPSLDSAIVTVFVNENNEGVPVYDYDLILADFIRQFSEDVSEADEEEDEYDFETMAVEWVSFNVIPSIIYMGPRAPSIIQQEDSEDLDMMREILKVTSENGPLDDDDNDVKAMLDGIIELNGKQYSVLTQANTTSSSPKP